MSSKRWDKEEKVKLVELFSSGKTFGEIAEILNRTESAIRLRLQTIVYEGVVKGLSIDQLMSTLKTTKANILQMFFTHKDFKETRGEQVISQNDVDIFISGIGNNNINIPKKNSTMTHDNIDVKKILEQNNVMDAIIKNHDLKKQIKSLYKNNKLKENEKKTLSKILE